MPGQARRRHQAAAAQPFASLVVDSGGGGQSAHGTKVDPSAGGDSGGDRSEQSLEPARSLVPSHSAAALYESGTQLVSQLQRGTSYFASAAVSSLYQLTDDRPAADDADAPRHGGVERAHCHTVEEQQETAIHWPSVLSQSEMPSRERTLEFRAAAKSQQMRVAAIPVVRPAASLVQRATHFNAEARRVGGQLAHTCAKLQRLAVLAKSGGRGAQANGGLGAAFDDEAAMAEVEQLAHAIKQDIGGLNGQIGQLQEGLSASHSGAPQEQTHSKSVVVGLQSRLATVSTEFKQLLELRSENVKSMKSRRDRFGASQLVPSSLPPSASTGHMGSVLLYSDATRQQQQRGRPAKQRGGAMHSGGGAQSDEGQVALDMDTIEMTRSQQQMLLVDEEQSYMRARNVAMETVESSIAELGQIFRQLAHLVSEQGETIQRIDSHVEETSLNVESAHMELLKYFRSISNNRWLALKVFGVLLVLFVFFIVFMT